MLGSRRGASRLCEGGRGLEELLAGGRDGEISGERMAEFGSLLMALGRVGEGRRAIQMALRLEGRSAGARAWRGRLAVADQGVERARAKREARMGGGGGGESRRRGGHVDDVDDDVEAYDAQLDILVGA